MSPHIFASPPATKALVTLILIENSQRMFAVWDDLRQHFLPTLLGSMRIANPVVPIPVLWLTTTPVGDDAASLNSAPPRQYNQLPELKFSFTPDNRISSRIIHRATELMLEAATQFQGGPVSFHLFVVAASPPLEGTWGVSVTMPSQIGQSEWRLLGQRIAQLGMHCHMILPASQDMSYMTELFTTNLELQGHTRVAPWFQTSPDYTFLLSGDPSDQLTIEPIEQQPLLPVSRPPVLRHQSFPQDVQSTPPTTPVPAQNGSTPSLVSSLQKVHGLSRKKLYGTQPPRQPFVREEPVRAKYRSTPTPLSIPVGSPPLPIPEDARVVGKTKVERGRRADRPHGDLSNSTSPVRRSPWNHASSDVGSSPSSPTMSHRTSPTMPLYPELAGYPTSPAATSPNFSPSIPETSFSDPSGYFSLSPSFRAAQGPGWTAMSMPTSHLAPMAKPTSMRRHSQELPHGALMQSLDAMSSKYRLDDARPKHAHKVKDAGDVPFIFSPELEAATAAKLQAALQSVPVSAFASDAYDASCQAPPTTPRPFGYEAVQAPTVEEDPRSFVGSTTSSLQGWAG